MKKLLYLMLFVAFLPLLNSCNGDDPEIIIKDYPANAQDIQGTWGCYRNGSNFTVEFNGNNYVLDIKNVFEHQEFYDHPALDNTIETVKGSFTMEGAIITLHASEGTTNTQFETLEAYWTDANKTHLILRPIGTFSRK